MLRWKITLIVEQLCGNDEGNTVDLQLPCLCLIARCKVEENMNVVEGGD